MSSPQRQWRAIGEPEPGPLAWMTRNSVAANLLMLVLIIGGLLMLPRIRQQVFPEFELDVIVVTVAYPGASPEEVEQGIVLPVEEAVRGVDGIKEVSSVASEGLATITCELLLGANADRALADIESAVGRVTSLPEDAEEPIIVRPEFRNEVIALVIHGDIDEANLRQLAEDVRADLLQNPEITTIQFSGLRPLEISVNIPQERLREFGLTHSQVAQAIRQASIDVPAGAIKTRRGEVLLRTTERRDRGPDFENIVVLSRPDGSQVRISDLGRVQDGYEESDLFATFNGERAVLVRVFRVGEQTPLGIAEVVLDYIEEHQGQMPPGVSLATWNNTSEFYRDRLDLLLRNARYGLLLVLVCLGLFLELRLAFWVTLGIPISFIGSLFFMPFASMSINMISMFAFILTLGMVVDDAIVVGEAIYTRRVNGSPPLKAAIDGVREVAAPVVFAILTSCIAFAPLLFVPGAFGKFFIQIPSVVILVLMLSLAESLLILPAHLAHRGGKIGLVWKVGGLLLALAVLAGGQDTTRLFIAGFLSLPFLVDLLASWKALVRLQKRFSLSVEWFIENIYAPILRKAIRARYFTIALSIATLTASIGLVAGGRVEVAFFPKIDSDLVAVQITMPYGTAAEDTDRVRRHVINVGRQVVERISEGRETTEGLFSQMGGFGATPPGPRLAALNSGSHVADVGILLVPSDLRPFTARGLADAWREELGEIPGVEALNFEYSTGAGSGKPIDFQLSHRNLETLETAAARLAEGLGSYAGVMNIDDGFSDGKEQLDFTLSTEARNRGLNELALARQLRDAFFGAEVLRQQRGRDEVRVYVRRPRDERSSLADLEGVLLRTPTGGEIPLLEAAHVERTRSYTQIRRLDGRRRVNVTAEVSTGTNADRIVREVIPTLLPELRADFPELRIELGGEQKRRMETMNALGVGFVLALLGMYALMAVAFRSYIQPVIIAAVIPFGLVGTILGHLLMQYDLSIMSMMGMVALSGVVVNDSLILVSAINEFRASGMTQFEAIAAGGIRRFRPILLTSLTTFLGLSPMILETSVGARFLIPMALSLGFGVLFATFITLVMVPALYHIVEDAKNLNERIFGKEKEADRTTFEGRTTHL